MKSKYKVLPEYRQNLTAQLNEMGISRHDIATESGLSYRAVSYFFEGKSDSKKVLHACIRLIKQRSTQDLRKAVERHERALQLI